MAIVTKRTVMSLHSDGACEYSHLVRFVLAVKGVNVEIVPATRQAPQTEKLAIDPEASLPKLVDRDLVLNNSRIIIEYLDERFPHPPLLPVYPVARAEIRKMMHRIETEWYYLMQCIQREENTEQARAYLAGSLTSLDPIFADKPFFLSDEFSLLDCVLAPLLWRLPKLGITIPDGASGLHAYMQKIFKMEAFELSLSEAEKQLQVA
jgi:RNA polymerase-associated protein